MIDWPFVAKVMVIGAFNRKLINYLGNHEIFKYFIKLIGSCLAYEFIIYFRNTSVATAVIGGGGGYLYIHVLPIQFHLKSTLKKKPISNEIL